MRTTTLHLSRDCQACGRLFYTTVASPEDSRGRCPKCVGIPTRFFGEGGFRSFSGNWGSITPLGNRIPFIRCGGCGVYPLTPTEAKSKQCVDCLDQMRENMRHRSRIAAVAVEGGAA